MLTATYSDHISKVPFITDYYIKIASYFYQLVNVISFSPFQSDHIKRLPLYNKNINSNIRRINEIAYLHTFCNQFLLFIILKVCFTIEIYFIGKLQWQKVLTWV